MFCYFNLPNGISYCIEFQPLMHTAPPAGLVSQDDNKESNVENVNNVDIHHCILALSVAEHVFLPAQVWRKKLNTCD